MEDVWVEKEVMRWKMSEWRRNGTEDVWVEKEAMGWKMSGWRRKQ